MTAETVVAGDMTLYAHWEEIVYTYSYIDNGDGTVTLSRYDANGNWVDEPISPLPVGEFMVPGEIEGKKVVAIGDSYFDDCRQMTSVVIPASVTNIAEYAFGWCDSLTDVVFEGGIDSIAMNVHREFCNTPWVRSAFPPPGR